MQDGIRRPLAPSLMQNQDDDGGHDDRKARAGNQNYSRRSPLAELTSVSGDGRWRRLIGRRSIDAPHQFHRSNKAIAPPGESLNEPGAVCRIPKRLPQLRHRGIQTSFELDKRVIRPQTLAEDLAGYHFAAILKQDAENAEGLVLQFDSNAALPQFPRFGIQFEASEAVFRRSGDRLSHGKESVAPINKQPSDL